MLFKRIEESLQEDKDIGDITWTCPACTLDNPSFLNYCNACETVASDNKQIDLSLSGDLLFAAYSISILHIW